VEQLGFDSIRMLIWCPSCHEQHIDPDGAKAHVLHRCEFCKLEWKFTEWNTLGVLSLPNNNHYARSAKPKCFATLKDFDEAVEYATKHLHQTEEQQEAMIKRVIAAAKTKTHWADTDGLGCFLILLGIATVIGIIGWVTHLK
jgi:hypothetical protein